MLLITIPVAVYSMIVGEDIVTLLFRRREFGLDSVRLTSSVFFWHMSGLAFIAMNRVIAPAFYARGDTKTPTWAGLVSVGVNIALAFVLVGPLKAPGIALALGGRQRGQYPRPGSRACSALGFPALRRPWPRRGAIPSSCSCSPAWRPSRSSLSDHYWSPPRPPGMSTSPPVSPWRATFVAFGGVGHRVFWP